MGVAELGHDEMNIPTATLDVASAYVDDDVITAEKGEPYYSGGTPHRTSLIISIRYTVDVYKRTFESIDTCSSFFTHQHPVSVAV